MLTKECFIVSPLVFPLLLFFFSFTSLAHLNTYVYIHIGTATEYGG